MVSTSHGVVAHVPRLWAVWITALSQRLVASTLHSVHSRATVARFCGHACIPPGSGEHVWDWKDVFRLCQ